MPLKSVMSPTNALKCDSLLRLFFFHSRAHDAHFLECRQRMETDAFTIFNVLQDLRSFFNWFLEF